MRKILPLVVLMVSCFNLYAQVSAAAERPTYTKGDTWTYRVLDAWTDKELRQFQTEFAAADGDNLVFRSTNLPSTGVNTNRTDLSTNSCRTMQNSTETVCAGPYKFPFVLGLKTSYDKLPYPNGSGYYQAECSVVAAEKVTVPAGEFDALKMECSGYWNSVFGSVTNGSFSETIWYAPSVKRYVKIYYENRNSRNRPSSKTTTELVSHKIQ